MGPCLWFANYQLSLLTFLGCNAIPSLCRYHSLPLRATRLKEHLNLDSILRPVPFPPTGRSGHIVPSPYYRSRTSPRASSVEYAQLTEHLLSMEPIPVGRVTEHQRPLLKKTYTIQDLAQSISFLDTPFSQLVSDCSEEAPDMPSSSSETSSVETASIEKKSSFGSFPRCQAGNPHCVLPSRLSQCITSVYLMSPNAADCGKRALKERFQWILQKH